MPYGNVLDDLPNEKAKKDFFSGYLAIELPECPTGIHPGEIVCYRIAFHAPEMIPFMPHVVRSRINYYNAHLEKCNICGPFFEAVETNRLMKFRVQGTVQ